MHQYQIIIPKEITSEMEIEHELKMYSCIVLSSDRLAKMLMSNIDGIRSWCIIVFARRYQTCLQTNLDKSKALLYIIQSRHRPNLKVKHLN
jgi:hypothetical protein